MSTLSAICAGPIVTDVKAGALAHLCSSLSTSPSMSLSMSLRDFMATPVEYRQSYLQSTYGIAFDGYSYHGQTDSTHQAPEDLLHTFVLSDFYPTARYPAEFQTFLAHHWQPLCKQIRSIEDALLQDIAPELVNVHRTDIAHMLSANYYPPAEQFAASACKTESNTEPNTQPNAVPNRTRLSEHPDVSLLTVFPFGTDSDLQYQCADGSWKPFPDTDQMVVFAGYLLEWLSGGVIPALNHRVALSQHSQQERCSFAVFSVPRPDVQLIPLSGAERMDTAAYFRQYLSLWDY